MQRPYHAIHKKDTQAWAHFLTQALLPMVELIEQSGVALEVARTVLPFE